MSFINLPKNLTEGLGGNGHINEIFFKKRENEKRNFVIVDPLHLHFRIGEGDKSTKLKPNQLKGTVCLNKTIDLGWSKMTGLSFFWHT